jgi:hypothetical protein
MIENALHVLDGVDFSDGTINTDDATIATQIAHSIRLGYPQVKPQPVQPARVCLVGGGPSLEHTVDELRQLYFEGAKIVTVNGSYQWCIERNFFPSAQIVLDARASNARFVDPAVPRCQYIIASQCHPDTWATVQGRDNVWIWHAAGPDSVHKPLLDAYYLGNWTQSPGGTTVIMRALTLLRVLGYVRMDLFGVDSCVMGGKHHAYAQPENDGDAIHPFTLAPPDRPELARTFLCTAWHAKQLECFLQTIRLYGDSLLLNVNGDGLLAHALRCGAEAQYIV